MKIVLMIAVLAAAGWFLYGRSRTRAPAAAPSPNAVERYGQSLADGVKKADEVRVKADAAVKRAEDARKAFSQTEPQ